MQNVLQSENEATKIDSGIERSCGEKMRNLLARLRRDLKENNYNVYHLISHAKTSSINKEKFIMSKGGMLSILDYRQVSDVKSAEHVHHNDASPSAIDIVALSNFLQQGDIIGLKNYLSAHPKLMNSTIKGRSFLSFALVNSKDNAAYLSMVRELSNIGITLSVSDLATSVELDKTTDFIAELAKYSREDLASSWNEKNINFNLVTFSAKQHRFEHALFFYTNFGIPVSVEQDFNVLDYVNLGSNDITAHESELILLAVKMRVTPYDVRRKKLIIKHMSRQ